MVDSEAIIKNWCAAAGMPEPSNGECHALTVALATQPQEVAPNLEDIEQYRLQMAGISTAAIGYWKEGDSIHPDYDTVALRDVAKLYAKYDELYRAKAPASQDAATERDRICAAIKAEDDYCVTNGDCMLDSDDCIKIVRGEWVRPDFSIDAALKQEKK